MGVSFDAHSEIVAACKLDSLVVAKFLAADVVVLIKSANLMQCEIKTLPCYRLQWCRNSRAISLVRLTRYDFAAHHCIFYGFSPTMA